MKCNEFSISDWLEGLYSKPMQENLEQHLAECEKCLESVSIRLEIPDKIKFSETEKEEVAAGWGALWPQIKKCLKRNKYSFSLEAGKDLASLTIELKNRFTRGDKSPQLFYRLAKALEFQGFIEEALTYMGKAVSLDMLNPDLMSELGFLRSKKKMAVAVFKKAHRFAPEESEKSVDRVPTVQKKKKDVGPKEEASIIENMLVTNPEDEKSRIELGQLYVELGRYDEAIIHWEKALETKKDIRDLLFWYNLGKIYLAKGKDGKAENCFRKMLELDPKGKENFKDEALHGLGQVLLKRGKTEQAIEQFTKAIKIDPHVQEYRVELGETLYHTEDLEGAEDEIEKALELNPDDSRALKLAAKTFMKQEDYRNALESMEKVVAMEPDNFAHYRMLSEIYHHLDCFINRDEAREKAIKLEPRIGRANAVAFDPEAGKGFITTIDCTAKEGKPDFQVSGHLGPVLNNTVEVAREYLEGNWKEIGIKPLSNYDIFINFSDPEYLSDGPSSGIPILAALVSAIKRIPISPLDVFAGALSIHGDIQRIGQIREKINAATSARKKRLFFPSENLNDFTEEERAGFEKRIKLVPVKTYKELFDIILYSLTQKE